MVESLCGKCAKYILFAFNFVFWLSGAALLGVGIWILRDRSVLQHLEALTLQADSAQLQLATYIIIGTGGAIFLIGFFGCCGAVRESKLLLCIYAFFMFLIIAAEVAAAVLVFFFQTRVEKFFYNNLKNELSQNYKENTTLRTAWDTLQEKFRCCGIDLGPSDWRETVWFRSEEARNNGTQVLWAPWACCRKETMMEGKGAQCQDEARGNSEQTEYLYIDGCYDKVLKWVKDNGKLLISLGAGIAALQILGLAFSCFLLYELKQEKSVGVTA